MTNLNKQRALKESLLNVFNITREAHITKGGP
jgi:hypothetical protein